jgi:DNA-binding LytR/AlgR family response regulator
LKLQHINTEQVSTFMNVLILEDELPARAKLEAMLHSIDPAIQVLAKLGSVSESLTWLSNNREPDLAFVDIQLSDDHSFEIFRKHPVKFPVIFTTAFDKFILESFEFNSIDYLLKPINEEKLARSLEKVKLLKRHFLQENVSSMIQKVPSSLSRIVARKGADFVALNTEEVAYFFSEHKVTFVRDFSGRQLMLDKNLAELETMLDRNFFRINRKYIANQKAIERFKPDSGKIQIFLKPEMKEEIFVSKETAPEFRKWIERC